MDYNKILFTLIKTYKWKKVKSIIENEEFDPNIRDNQNNYLLTYLIMFNRNELIELIIKKGARTNILIDNDKSLIYLPIKFDNYKIIEILIKHDKLNVGVSILNVRDKNDNIPLHYAIQFKNSNIIKLLLEAGSDVNIQDKDGHSSLHLAVFSKDLDICKMIIEKSNINLRTFKGDNALHIACKLSLYEICKLLIDNKIKINAQDYEHKFTTLHYAVNLNYTKIMELILSYKPKINIQDIYGNTVLHYAIIQVNNENIRLLLDKCKNEINFNLWNISSKIPLHLLIEKKYEEFIDDTIISKSNLNIQDEDGNSCLHLLCRNDLWKSYKNILKTKRLDIFIRNNDKQRPIDFISDNDINEFINIAVNSYIYTLRHKDAVWMNEWENVCKNKTPSSKLNNFVNKKLNNNDDACSEYIELRIREEYEKDMYEFSSFPRKIGNVCLNLKMDEDLKVCTFTGTSLDILIGLIYLLEKHKDACSTLSSNFMINNDLCIFYKSIGISLNNKCDFLNFEIVWTHLKLYISTDFVSQFKKCNKRFIIIPLGIELKEGSHANYIIYDKKLNEIERFEPHGVNTPLGFNYSPKLLDASLKSKFFQLGVQKYIRPKDYLPNISFQMLDAYDLFNKYIGDPSGFCALWSIWYVDMRLEHQNIKRDKLVRKLIKEIKRNNLSFRKLIRNYAKNILTIRDAILSSGGIDINEWLSGKYTNEQYNNIINSLRLRISKVI